MRRRRIDRAAVDARGQCVRAKPDDGASTARQARPVRQAPAASASSGPEVRRARTPGASPGRWWRTRSSNLDEAVNK